jgi:carbon monoxide dehydrogenase subunit G
LFAQLTDLDQLAATIPDLVSSERVDECTLRCVVRPGFSFLRGTLKATIALSEVRPPEEATMNVAASGIGTSLSVASKLRIAPEGEGSRLIWEATVSDLKGLVAALSPTLIKAAADQVIRHAWQQIRAKLGEA